TACLRTCPFSREGRRAPAAMPVARLTDPLGALLRSDKDAAAREAILGPPARLGVRPERDRLPVLDRCAQQNIDRQRDVLHAPPPLVVASRTESAHREANRTT